MSDFGAEFQKLKTALVDDGITIDSEKAPWYGTVGVSYYFTASFSGVSLPVRASDHGVGESRAAEALNYLLGSSDPHSFARLFKAMAEHQITRRAWKREEKELLDAFVTSSDRKALWEKIQELRRKIDAPLFWKDPVIASEEKEAGGLEL